MVATAVPDKELCKVLILQGIPYKEIAAQTGVTEVTLRQWKSRHGWGNLLRAKEAIVTAHQTKLDQPKPEHSERLKTGIAKELVKDLELVESKPSKSLKDAASRQNVLSTMASTAKTVFGWGDTGSTTTFNTFNFSARTVSAIEVPPAIDIPSQPVESKQVTQLDNQSNTTDGVSSAKPTA